MNDNVMSVATDYINFDSKIMSILISFFSNMAKIFVNLLICTLFIVVVFLSFVFVDSKINNLKGNKVSPFISTYVIVTPSMSPTIKVDDAVVVMRKSAASLKKGDIITFKSSDSRYNGYTITHRIVDIIRDSSGDLKFITKGDNNSLVDEAFVSENDIYGKVVVKVPYLGVFKQFFLNKIIFTFVVCLPLVVLLVYFVLKNIKLNNCGFNKNNKIYINENGENIEIEII